MIKYFIRKIGILVNFKSADLLGEESIFSYHYRFGHVYLARERTTKHVVAIKILSKKQIINSDVIGQIRR
jgi:serine/threonine protein kinase